MSTKPEQSISRAESISLIDILLVMARKWKLIAVFTLTIVFATLVLMVYTIVVPSDSRWNPLPNTYRPTAKIFIRDVSQNTGGLSSLLGQNSSLQGLSGLLGASAIGGTSTKADFAQALIKGNTIADQIVEGLNIRAAIHQTDANRKSTARRFIQGGLTTRYDQKSGIIDVGFTGIDPVLATNIVNRAIDLLEAEYSRFSSDTSSDKITYLATSIEKVKVDSDKANDALAAFQARYGVIDLPSQASSNIQQISQLQAQILNTEMELSLQRKYFPESDPRIEKLKTQLEQYKQLQTELTQGPKQFSTGSIPAKELPELSVQYMALKRDAEIQTTILSLLKQQYETEKIQEFDNSKIFQIIERAEIPESRFGPGRSKIMVVTSFIGFFTSLLLAFVVDYFEHAQRDPIESTKLAAIRRTLPFRKKEREE